MNIFLVILLTVLCLTIVAGVSYFIFTLVQNNKNNNITTTVTNTTNNLLTTDSGKINYAWNGYKDDGFTAELRSVDIPNSFQSIEQISTFILSLFSDNVKLFYNLKLDSSTGKFIVTYNDKDEVVTNANINSTQILFLWTSDLKFSLLSGLNYDPSNTNPLPDNILNPVFDQTTRTYKFTFKNDFKP